MNVADSMLTLSNVLIPDPELSVAMDDVSDPELTAAATAALTLAVVSSSCCVVSTATVVVIIAPDVRRARRLRRDEMAHSWGPKLEALTPGIFCASAWFMTVSSISPQFSQSTPPSPRVRSRYVRGATLGRGVGSADGNGVGSAVGRAMTLKVSEEATKELSTS